MSAFRNVLPTIKKYSVKVVKPSFASLAYKLSYAPLVNSETDGWGGGFYLSANSVPTLVITKGCEKRVGIKS